MRTGIAALLVACAAPCAQAETLYVIEQLYVTVNSAADGSGERVGQIKSADQVELLEREGEQAHVRLASGEEGWVKASYLSADPPLRTQLDARSDELERIRKEKTQLESELAAAKTAAASATALAKAAARKDASAPAPASAATNAAPAKASDKSATAGPVASNDPPAADATGEGASQSPPPLFQDEPMMPSRPSWLVSSAVALLALAAGFALGWRMLDRRIRAKYGGLRIY
jgi:uncharacterized protein YgiM (DUF1202 family)